MENTWHKMEFNQIIIGKSLQTQVSKINLFSRQSHAPEEYVLAMSTWETTLFNWVLLNRNDKTVAIG